MPAGARSSPLATQGLSEPGSTIPKKYDQAVISNLLPIGSLSLEIILSGDLPSDYLWDVSEIKVPYKSLPLRFSTWNRVPNLLEPPVFHL